MNAPCVGDLQVMSRPRSGHLHSTPRPPLTSHAHTGYWHPISGPVSSFMRWGQSSLPLLKENTEKRACQSKCCHSRHYQTQVWRHWVGGTTGSEEPEEDPCPSPSWASDGHWPKARGAGPQRDPGIPSAGSSHPAPWQSC